MKGKQPNRKGFAMELKAFEVELAIMYYTDAIEHLMYRLDHIEEENDYFDNDLRDAQIQRIRKQMDEHGERIKELEDYKKTL